MSVLVAYEREIGHPDAESRAQRVDPIRRRLAQTGSALQKTGPVFHPMLHRPDASSARCFVGPMLRRTRSSLSPPTLGL